MFRDRAFQSSFFNACSFRGLAFTNAYFGHCSLLNTTFTECDLEGAVFLDCLFGNTVFSSTNLRGCTFANLLLNNIDFDGYQCDLAHATFQGTQLNEVRFSPAVTLRAARLRDVVFYNCDLSDANLEQANFEGSVTILGPKTNLGTLERRLSRAQKEFLNVDLDDRPAMSFVAQLSHGVGPSADRSTSVALLQPPPLQAVKAEAGTLPPVGPVGGPAMESRRSDDAAWNRFLDEVVGSLSDYVRATAGPVPRVECATPVPVRSSVTAALMWAFDHNLAAWLNTMARAGLLSSILMVAAMLLPMTRSSGFTSLAAAAGYEITIGVAVSTWLILMLVDAPRAQRRTARRRRRLAGSRPGID